MDRPWAADLDACVCNFCISPCRVLTVLTVTVHLQQSSASSITLSTARGCSQFVGPILFFVFCAKSCLRHRCCAEAMLNAAHRIGRFNVQL